MGDRSKIEPEWQTITAAKRLGVTVEEYVQRRLGGEKWCSKCRDWHVVAAFGVDRTRGDGLAPSCLKSKSVRQRALKLRRPRRGWLVVTRDGDKKQARRRVNYLVEQGRIPHPDDLPCMDCSDEVFSHRYRHEYDHARGYDGANQLYVEPVCSKCHRNREEARRAEARA